VALAPRGFACNLKGAVAAAENGKVVTTDREPKTARLPLLGLAAVVALAVAAVVVWMLVREGGEPETVPSRPASVELASVGRLQALADSERTPVFWAGRRPGMRYELSQTPSGRIYIRYLPRGVEAGDPQARYLTVGTYPVKDAIAATRRSGDAKGAVVSELAGGAVAVYNENSATSVFVAFPGIPRQIEVFDPSPEVARKLVDSGRIIPILGKAVAPKTGAPVAATEAQLREVAASLDHPLYWLGPKRGFTYELTRLADSEIYIRYLPQGIAVADERPEYESVGTYAAEDGLAAAKSAGGDDVLSFDIPNGGTAYYSRSSPTNVHFAFPGSRYQVEVFHPVAAQAQGLVRSGTVVPIS
jgi:hypothetical protein